MNRSVSDKIKLLFVISICFIGCNSDTNVYTGETMKLEFAGVNSIQDLHWIEIDGIRYTHYEDYELQGQDNYSLPASKSRYEANEIERFEPNNPFSIALLLNLQTYRNSEKNGFNTAVIIPSESYQLHIGGVLILQRADSTTFTITAPTDYPVKISVVE